MKPVKLGSRRSPMAMVQTELVRSELQRFHPALRESGMIQIVPIQTSADRIQDRSLADIGGKGLFTKEIEDALLQGTVDMAVHSMKDVPTWLPQGLEVACMLRRDDPRDVLVSRFQLSLDELPRGATVGTASLRRKSQLLFRWPHLRIVPYRGNANTRLSKLEAGAVDATILALSGLQRISRSDVITKILSLEEMLPAVGQGALGVEIRTEDAHSRQLLEPLRDSETEICVGAERAFLATLDGSCRTPIAGLATLHDGGLRLRGLLATPNGEQVYHGDTHGSIGDAADIARNLAQSLLVRQG
jgi:hydroxymethylbilane synthase